MQIKTRQIDDVLVFDMAGRLDHQTSSDANDAVAQIIKDSNNKMFLINLKGLEYISSAGLSVILLAAKLIKSSSGKIKICEAQGVVKEVLEIAGFNSLLSMYESEKEGIASFAN
ncbi:MAG: anti-sigma factor antagonist [Bacteroidetes bacterium]|nr:MAG: anti-sigma factor antagonist [Bacteroidota bacterium]TDI75170.1 MAG: anti-sigma factor antagonist [Bacteroidota bacterium]